METKAALKVVNTGVKCSLIYLKIEKAKTYVKIEKAKTYVKIEKAKTYVQTEKTTLYSLPWSKIANLYLQRNSIF